MNLYSRATILVAALLLPSPSAAQSPKPVCDLVTEADAAAVIGPVQQKQAILGADQCVFTVKGMSLMINRLTQQDPEQIEMMMQLPKNRARKGDQVKDEPGIGDRAVSEVSRGHLLVMTAVGDTVWSFGVDAVYNTDISATLPKLRELAKKVAGGK